jgi:hypothetical protein
MPSGMPGQVVRGFAAGIAGRRDRLFSPRTSAASIEAGFELEDCFSAPNSEVVFAIKKPLRHHSLWVNSLWEFVYESGQERHGAH